MSTNEQDRTDGAGRRLASTDKRGDRTELLVDTGATNFEYLVVDRSMGGSHATEIGWSNLVGVRASFLVPDVALDDFISGLLHARDLRDANAATAEVEGGAVVEALRGTPDGESLAVAADMDREGRAA